MKCFPCFQLISLIFAGFLCRWVLINSSYQKILENRVELSTPVNAWKRAVEGVYLHKQGISPYLGDTFHESPLHLHFYTFILENLTSNCINFMFILLDILTGLIIAYSVRLQINQINLLEKNEIEHIKSVEDRKSLALGNADYIFKTVVLVYLLSPYQQLVCVAKSTSIFNNLAISLLFLSVSLKQRIFACFFAAFLGFTSFYYIPLIIPVTLIIELLRSQTSNEEKNYIIYDVSSIICTLAIYFLQFITFQIFGWYLSNQNLDFISSTYGFSLFVEDLTPNIGLFWYFFTEMFDHFRNFFLWTFQINAFIYAIPLALTLRKNPYFLLFIQLILISLFKPYPSVSDFSIYLCLLPQWKALFNLMKQGLVICCVFISCTILAPIMWQMWIVLGTANSNFYFAVTLAYNTAQILLVTDFLFAFTKRQFFLETGTMKDDKGKPLKMELKHE